MWSKSWSVNAVHLFKKHLLQFRRYRVFHTRLLFFLARPVGFFTIRQDRAENYSESDERCWHYCCYEAIKRWPTFTPAVMRNISCPHMRRTQFRQDLNLAFVRMPDAYFTQLPMRRMRICFACFFCFFVFLFFVFFSSVKKMRRPFSGTAERIFMKLTKR